MCVGSDACHCDVQIHYRSSSNKRSPSRWPMTEAEIRWREVEENDRRKGEENRRQREEAEDEEYARMTDEERIKRYGYRRGELMRDY